MIGTVSREIGGVSHTFKLSTRAMMAIEESTGKDIITLLDGLSDGFAARTIATFLAECGKEGAGLPMAQAQGLIDALGFKDAGALLSDIVSAAFPKAEASEKNG